MKFFKKGPDKRPFSYGAIIEQRKSPDRTPVIVGVVLVLLIISGIYFLMAR